MLNIRSLKQSTAIGVLALTGAIFVPMLASAQATLQSADGTINLTGDIVSFENGIYGIRTSFGDLNVKAEGVTCAGDGCPSIDAVGADVQFAGSDTVGLGLMPLLLSGYAAHLGAEADLHDTGIENEIIADLVSDGGFGDDLGSYKVTSTGSSDAFRALLAQNAEIGMSSRRIRPEEARALRDQGAGNMIDPTQEHILAVDSLVVIANPNNPVNSLTMNQLAKIYSGEITNWAEVGGEDKAIVVGTRPSSSGTLDVFTSVIFEGADTPVAADAVEQLDHDTMADMVAENDAAIGFVGYAFQRGAKPLTLVNDCGIAMQPDAFSARTEEYALQRRLYLYKRGDVASAEASGFLDFALSPDADGVIAKSGFIDLGVDRRVQSLDGDRAHALLDTSVPAFEGGVMREMLGAMGNFDRLSTTMRFDTGSSRLDPRARLDIDRLIDYLETQPADTQVKFVGFTDDVGNFTGNRTLSEERAARVMNEVATAANGRLDNIEMDFGGYGEIAPSACNTTEVGRKINRRVEVWIISQG